MSSESGHIGCRLEYIRTIPGVLKLIELFCDILAVILCGAPSTPEGGSGHKGFFLFVSILALIITLVIFVLAMLNVPSVCLKNQWPFIEMGWCVFIALFYFIASIVIATIGKYNGAYGAAAFFGFAAFITYVADAVFQFRGYRNNSAAQHAQQYAPSQPTHGQQTYGQQTYGQQYGSDPAAQHH